MVAEAAAVVVTAEVAAVIVFAAALVALSGRVGHTFRGGRRSAGAHASALSPGLAPVSKMDNF